MGKASSFTPTWGCRQTQGVAGLAFMTLLSVLAASELPLVLGALLGSGQIAGLGVAAIACFYTVKKGTSVLSGSGVLCPKCELPTVAGTYHCEICGFCVSAHSHHSRWLNCCICARNGPAYLLSLAALGVAAACQVAVGGVFLAFIVQNHGIRYSFHYFNGLFHLFFLTAVLLSIFLLAISCFTLLSHTLKLLSMRKPRKHKVKPIYVLSRPVAEGNLVLGTAVKLYSDSFDSHSAEITGISAIREAESGGPMLSGQ